MEVGVGIHGEPGRRREKITTADAIVDEMFDAVAQDMPFNSGDRVAMMVNGLGGTPITELYVLYARRATSGREGRLEDRAQLRRRILHLPRDGRRVADDPAAR